MLLVDDAVNIMTSQEAGGIVKDIICCRLEKTTSLLLKLHYIHSN